MKLKYYVDQHRREVNYEAGDLVHLKISPYNLKSLARKRNEKLSPCLASTDIIKLLQGMEILPIN